MTEESYKVLARKYRPEDFSTVTGQEQVTKSLANAIRRHKVAHAFLFAGPRGVGKTSTARIFSKALNCENGPTPEPCGKCKNCVAIKDGRSLAVREIDGASHNSVDNVRDLIDDLRSSPPPGSRYKIYIIDEVHMLSTAAFNALLKTLEEPPSHTVFILATTEVHKIPETVLSRCQRHDFRALTLDHITHRLQEIAKEEKLSAEPEALRMVARLADGSMRDAQSLLDRVQVFCDGKLTEKAAAQMLGLVERRLIVALSEAILARNGSESLAVLGEVFRSGSDAGLFMKELVAHWRELLLARFGEVKLLEDLGVPEEQREELERLSKIQSADDLQDLVQIVREGCDTAMRSAFPRYALEALVVRMATRRPVREISEILAELKRSGGTAPVRPSQPAPQYSAPRTASGPAPRPSAPRSESEAPTPPPPASGGDWPAFVRYLGSSPGEKMLSEQLKRLAVEQFEPGFLKASGPKFSVDYTAKPDNMQKLVRLLGAFSGTSNWRVEISAGETIGAPATGSIAHEQRREASKREETARKNIENHPKIQSLKQAFPGTTIENIKINKE